MYYLRLGQYSMQEAKLPDSGHGYPAVQRFLLV